MSYITVIVLAIVQGLTEFLPVSSSGHLVLLHNILPYLPVNDVVFDVFLHLGTLASVIVFFYSDLKKILYDLMYSLRNVKKINADNLLAFYIILATIPAAVLGYLFDDMIEKIFRSVLVVAFMLIIVGILFLFFENISKKNHSLTSLNGLQALIIGFAQALALIPGTSRSGITIIAGMGIGLTREAAVRFSFLISLPIILGANIKKITSIEEVISHGGLIFLSLGLCISFVTGYFVIKYFMQFVKNHNLNIFAYYRFALAITILLLYHFHLL